MNNYLKNSVITEGPPEDNNPPFEGCVKVKVKETITIVPIGETDISKAREMDVEVNAWKDTNSEEVYLSGSTCQYLDCIKAREMGIKLN